MPGRTSNQHYQTLLNDAKAMLTLTNVYLHDIEDIHYSRDGVSHSLIGIIKERASKKVREAGEYDNRQQRRRPSDRNKEAFSVIYDSMVSFANDYPASFPVKQRVKNRFAEWVTAIKTEYGIQGYDEDIKVDFGNACADTAVVMLQMLQEPEGVTKNEIAASLGISERAVLKNLSKIDNSFGESEQTAQQLYIGGQPVQAKIKTFRTDGERVSRYRTVNTVHPIILQENVMQAGTLIQALARNFKQYESEISYIVGMEIWSQLSEYGKDRIRRNFAYGDKEVGEFIDILDDDCPIMKLAAYYTERDMAADFRLSDRDILRGCAKAARRCKLLKLIIDEEVIQLESAVVEKADGSGNWHSEEPALYRARSEGREDVYFTVEQVARIEWL